MFDYKGFSAEEVEELCASKYIQRYCIRSMYNPSEIYSQGYYFRQYAQFPYFLPLMVFSEHGIEFGHVGHKEIENDAYAMLVFSDYKKINYQKASKKICYKVLHPLIWYRRNNIEQSPLAKGTLAFPSHSTSKNDCIFDIEKYIQELKSLPLDMQPVCVSLHISDIKKGQHLEFIKHGIPVYTAGNPADYRYGERFYNILKNFKYGTSNLVGSYAYFCVEMGIPFSLFGQESKYINTSGDRIYDGDYKEREGYQIAENVFSGIHKHITNEQKEHVEKNIGTNPDLSRNEMKTLFYKAFLKKGLTPRVFFYIIKYLLFKYIFRCKL